MASAELIQRLLENRVLDEIPRSEIPLVLGQLETAKARLFTRLVGCAGDPEARPAEAQQDKLIDATQAGEILGVTPRWLYRHARSLPFARRLSRKVLRFSVAGLRKWQATRKS